MYQGPTAEVKAFFAQLGFKCPERKGVADFLQEVTSAKDQQVPCATPGVTCWTRVSDCWPSYCIFVNQSLALQAGLHGARVWSFWSAVQQYWASRHPYRMVTAVEMAERFKFEFHGGMAIAEELARPIPPETQKQNVGLHLAASSMCLP